MMEIEEGQMFKHPIEIVLLDGPLGGEKQNPTHQFKETILVNNVFRYRFKTCTEDMRTFFYEYDE